MKFEVWWFFCVNFAHFWYFCVLGHVAEGVYQNVALLLGPRLIEMHAYPFQLQASQRTHYYWKLAWFCKGMLANFVHCSMFNPFKPVPGPWGSCNEPWTHQTGRGFNSASRGDKRNAFKRKILPFLLSSLVVFFAGVEFNPNMFKRNIGNHRRI